MITRHMRTHIRPNGSSIPFSELLISPIAQLSLNSTTAPDLDSIANNNNIKSGSISPLPLKFGRRSLNHSPSYKGVTKRSQRKIKKKLIDSVCDIINDKKKLLKENQNKLKTENLNIVLSNNTNNNNISHLFNKRKNNLSSQPINTTTTLCNDLFANNNSMNPNLILSTLRDSLNGKLLFKCFFLKIFLFEVKKQS